MSGSKSVTNLAVFKKLSLGILLTGVLIFTGSLLFLEISWFPALYVVPLFGGMWFEHYRRQSPWDMIFMFTITAAFVSLLLSLIGEEVTYLVVLKRWPWLFTLVFAFLSGITSGRKYTQRLGEGMTVLQSMALLYFILEKGMLSGSGFILNFLAAIWLAFAAFSIFQGLTHFQLNGKVRFLLSIWSSFIMLLFSGVYVYDTLHMDFSKSFDVFTVIKEGIVFFLLGYSSFHIAHNWFMIFGFLPWSTRGFDKSHRKGMQELAKLHIARYDREQTAVSQIWLVLLVCLGVFGINYHFQIFPELTIIWLLFWLLPYVVRYHEQRKFSKNR